MQKEMDDTYTEVVKLKKTSDELTRILGEDSEATGQIERQISEFKDCWKNLAHDIQERIRKVKKYRNKTWTVHSTF